MLESLTESCQTEEVGLGFRVQGNLNSIRSNDGADIGLLILIEDSESFSNAAGVV